MTDKHTRMTSYDLQRIEEAAELLHGSFLWHETDEDHMYWSQVHTRLKRMAEALRAREDEA